jgi:hypothetical protein
VTVGFEYAVSLMLGIIVALLWHISSTLFDILLVLRRMS